MTTITLSDGTELDVSAYPLPEGVEDVVMNRQQIAHAMNTSEVSITAWVNKGMPVLSRGGNGTAYEFQPSHCWAWRMHDKEVDAKAREAADNAAAQMRLAFQNLDDDQADDQRHLTPKQVSEIAEADYKRNRAAELRGDLVRVDRVRALQERQLNDFRQAAMALPDFAEQEFGLTPAQAEKMQRRCEAMLGEVSLTLRQLLPEHMASELSHLQTAEQGNLL